jgi:CheY-like chemotaxis protein
MNKNRVMICDDDPVIHSTIKEMLSEYDDVFEFVSVYDGE